MVATRRKLFARVPLHAVGTMVPNASSDSVSDPDVCAPRRVHLRGANDWPLEAAANDDADKGGKTGRVTIFWKDEPADIDGDILPMRRLDACLGV